MNRAEAEEFTATLGLIAGGAARQVRLGLSLGVPASLGLDTGDWVRRALAGVALSLGERRDLVAELAATGMRQQDIADSVGAGQATISRDLHGDGQARPLPPGRGDGGDGEIFTVNNPMVGGRPAPTGEVNWYSPGRIVEPARQAMGGIDLDPASCPEANRVIKAKRIWTAEDDGLRRPWSGRVWLNPPWGRNVIDRFVGYLINAWRDGDVKQACVLLPNNTETLWFQEIADVATAISFPDGRLDFWHDDPGRPEITGVTQGQAVVYLGGRQRAFINAYSPHGLVVTPVT